MSCFRLVLGRMQYLGFISKIFLVLSLLFQYFLSTAIFSQPMYSAFHPTEFNFRELR